jgi:two-component system CitB family sensor kinase
VQVSVRDSGPGVDAAIRERVFEAGVSSKPRVGSGADHGFGLAIVRLVTTRRGGHVTYRNDNGALFTATLPVRAVAHV